MDTVGQLKVNQIPNYIPFPPMADFSERDQGRQLRQDMRPRNAAT
jgi:hypothetical protein